jgi:hypothetical protein
MPIFRLLISRLLGVAAVSFVITMPAMAQQVISEPGYCAQFYPYANCQNKGPGNPYTDSNYQRRVGPGEPTWSGDRTVGVAGKRARTYRFDSSGGRMQ